MFSELKTDFVCGYRDITGEPWAGKSDSHPLDGQAYIANNGAGAHNIQLFFLTPDGVVLHCLPGYWNSEDLAGEALLAQQLNQVWQNPSLSPEQKDKIFHDWQLRHVQEHSVAMKERSKLEGFDMKHEAHKKGAVSDVIDAPLLITDPKMPPKEAFKTTDVIVHERMALRPFVKYADFDVAAFSDYGQQRYDKNENKHGETPKWSKVPPAPAATATPGGSLTDLHTGADPPDPTQK